MFYKFNFEIIMKILLFIMFLAGCCGQGFCNENTPTVSTEVRSSIPTQIYGPKEGEVALLIGNGGAGPTCLLQELSEDFIRHNELNIRIGWIQTITRLTLENLKEGIIDVSLTYEEEPEILALNEGWATERTLVFNDHFLLVGPKSNPAHLTETDTIEEAFNKISKSGSSFFSRNDFSGTNERERTIWNKLSLKPWEDNSAWYVTKQLFPADSLIKSDKESLYTLTDRGTLLAVQDELKNMAVYTQNGEILMNRCHAMLKKNPSANAKLFLEYLKSDRAQSLIGFYAGKKKKNCIGCCPLFTAAKEDNFLQKKCLEKLGFSKDSKN